MTARTVTVEEQSSTVTVVDAPDTNDRRTPRWFFEQCQQRYGPFDLDAAASPANHLCARYYTEADNALTIARWCADQVFCNPPYGPGGTIEKWIAKVRQQRDAFRVRTLMLLPADTSTRWYHDVRTTELIELVRGRLTFDGPVGVQQNTAKFGSVLLWVAPKIQRPKKIQRAKSLFDGAIGSLLDRAG